MHYLNPRKGTETYIELDDIVSQYGYVHYLNPRKGTETYIGDIKVANAHKGTLP